MAVVLTEGDSLMKKMLIALCLACLCVLFGCSQSSAGQQAASSDTGSSSAAQESSGATSESASADAEACDVPADGMPEYDFGFDEGEYLVKTYGLENAERLDLIDSNQLAWLALNKVRVIVVAADPEGEKSKDMISAAQKSANGIGGTLMVSVYEPQRDAEDKDWAKLTEKIVDSGVANLEDIAPEKILLMSKQAVGEDGSPAPVKNVIAEADNVQTAIEEAFELACCG